MTCRIGSHVLQVGPNEDVKLMVPANDLLGTGRLKQRLKEEGYLYLKDQRAKNSKSPTAYSTISFSEWYLVSPI